MLRSPRLAGANSDPLAIRQKRKRELRFGYQASYLLLEQRDLLVNDGNAFGWRVLPEVFERGTQPPSHLRRARSGLAYLVEGEMDIRIPRHRGYDQTHDPLVISMDAVGKQSVRELSQAVVESVDGLYRGRRIEKR